MEGKEGGFCSCNNSLRKAILYGVIIINFSAGIVRQGLSQEFCLGEHKVSTKCGPTS